MRLLIGDKLSPESLKDYCMSFSDFKDKACHPFIATHGWDSVVLEVCDKTPKGYIRQLLPIACISVVMTSDKVNTYQVQVLGEVFPDAAVEIKKLYMDGNIDGLHRLVDQLNRKA